MIRTRETMDLFAARLTAARQAVFTSPYGLADALGITVRQLYRYERAEVIPLADRYFAIAKVLNICPYYLMGHTDTKDVWSPPMKETPQ